MAYEPQEWKPFQEGGTIITADALNYMEAGIAETSASQDELVDYCYQLDNDIRESTQASMDQLVNNVNVALQEQADEFNSVNATNFNTLKGYTDETAATLREEIAAVPSTTVAFNTFSWSSSIAVNTLSVLGSGSVSGDGPLALSSNMISVPDTVKVAFLTLKGYFPLSAATTGRRFMEVTEGSDTEGIRQELYIGDVTGISLILRPGYLYTVKAFCCAAGTAKATATAVSFI